MSFELDDCRIFAKTGIRKEESMWQSQVSNLVATPWHLWLTGVSALLWNSMGALDYFMTQTQN